jgi:proline iminopeptidase
MGVTDLHQVLDIGGINLHYADSGVGEPVLLRSGGPGLRDYLGGIAAGVASDIRVVRMDPRGCGKSTPDGQYDDAVTVQDIERLRSHLGIERCVVAGHSHGAHQVLRYALTFPERVRGIVYIAGIGLQRDRSWSEAYHAGLDQGGDREPPPEMFEANPEAHRLGNASYAAFIRRPSLWKEIAGLDVPFLAITAERDIRPDWPVRQMVELMPSASMVTIPGAPHALWYTHPRELEEQIVAFVADLD